ncbi:hypothetical protein EVAR_29042_1 [Eumeta japonica]|uniref:Uncharacterized protein n=1 Tax=Eumeta variegata TaxID=151549 RepID=A0A4C1W543_EUMVA|nr:hypothetical protein EVAR_29042_1 [Eumeta japonica]
MYFQNRISKTIATTFGLLTHSIFKTRLSDLPAVIEARAYSVYESEGLRVEVQSIGLNSTTTMRRGPSPGGRDLDDPTGAPRIECLFLTWFCRILQHDLPFLCFRMRMSSSTPVGRRCTGDGSNIRPLAARAGLYWRLYSSIASSNNLNTPSRDRQKPHIIICFSCAPR